MKRHTNKEARSRLRQRLAKKEPIYCISPNERKFIARVRSGILARLEKKLGLPDIVLLNTWAAESVYLEETNRHKSIIAIDVQDALRNAHLLKAFLMAETLGPLQAYTNYLALALELFVSVNDADSAERLLQNFHDCRLAFAANELAATQKRPSPSPETQKSVVTYVAWAQTDGALSYLVGHEIGHHLCNLEEIREEFVAVKTIGDGRGLRDLGSNTYFDSRLRSDSELVFDRGRLVSVRKARRGAKSLAKGLANDYKYRQEERERGYDVEDFCDYCGLIFLVNELLKVNAVFALRNIWPLFAAAHSIRHYFYFAAHDLWPQDIVSLRGDETKKRFMTAPYVLKERLTTSPIVAALGWSDEWRSKASEQLSEIIKAPESRIEALSDNISETFIGSACDAFADGKHTSREVDLTHAIDTTKWRYLFLGEGDVPNELIGLVFAFRSVLDVVRDGRFHAQSQKKITSDLKEKVIAFRADWNKFFFQQAEQWCDDPDRFPRELLEI